ncbi:MAG TPA: response regulator [Noviherbaspirillum sp.]|uniref:response regulator n=1 Tax=Noviherbaspirillum sp. TaxID=1926288 RepID=UPI002B470671|nr:response regulator [Noviherbaspirillum sp.]HJV87757.1 response regulator [Noviherbaspirillum sp.]
MLRRQTSRFLSTCQDDANQTLRIKRYYIAAGSSLLVIGLLFACVLQGILSLASFSQSAALILFSCVLFFILFRSGLNQRFADPSLTRLQMWSATAVIVFTMYRADQGRAVFLIVLLMIFLFGVLRLTRRALLWHATGILLAYGAVIGLLWSFKRHTLDLQLELLQWFALAATLPWFAAMGGYLSGLRNQQKRLNRTLRLLSDCNISMLHASSERDLFNNLCRILVESGGYMMAAVDIADQGEAKTFRRIAQCRGNDTCGCSIDLPPEGSQDIGRTVTETAISSGTTHARRECPGNPFASPGRDGVQRQDGCAWAALPLIVDGQTSGALALCSKSAAAFHQDELTLLEELAANLAYGMQSLRAREELVRQRQLLEERVEQRTQEIAALNAELIVKARDADIANRAKSAFLATISHEIRNPLNAVVSLAQLIGDSRLNPNQREYVDNLQLSAQTLSMLIGDILDLSRIEAGALCLEQAPFSLDAVLQRVAAVVCGALRGKPVELVFDVAPDMPVTLTGDALRLQQILLNLAGNAAKFTEQGEVVVSIHPLAQADGQVTVQFTVRDTGIGIPDAYLDQIFEAFSQGDASRAREYGGAGLGLAISARLVELMGGRIAVESVEGKGTSFGFNVQLGMPEGTPTTRMMPGPPGLHLLIIDDHLLVGDILQRACFAFGWHATVARSAATGLERLRLSMTQGPRYDLMLVDWHMPAMNGIEMLRQAQYVPGIRLPPVLLMASTHEAGNAAAASDGLDVCGVLAKPVTAASLADAVRSACGADSTTVQPVRRATDACLAGMRVLVAEDNAINRRVLEQLLRHAGAEVVVAANGLEAVNAIRDSGLSFDAVLMDIHMPVMDGYAATRIIREEIGRRDLPIIAVTADALPGDIEKTRRVGMMAHLIKPVDISRLLAVVTNARHLPRHPYALHEQAGEERKPPAALPVVDLAAGLQIFNGNKKDYADLLRQFVMTYRDTVDEVRHCITDADPALASEILHGIHGAARFLQIRHLGSVVASLGAALREEHGSAVIQLLEEFQSAMQALQGFVQQFDETQMAGEAERT